MHRRKDQILHQKARRLIEEKIISQKKEKKTDIWQNSDISITPRVHTYILKYILRETGETRKEADFLLKSSIG